MIPTDDDSESESSSMLGLGGVDFSGVDFDADPLSLSKADQDTLEWERQIVFGDYAPSKEEAQDDSLLPELGSYLENGNYVEALQSKSASDFLAIDILSGEQRLSSVAVAIRNKILSRVTCVADCVKLEFIGIAALNLFLQLNYTGPSLEEGIPSTTKEDPLSGINPHPCFAQHLSALESESSNQLNRPTTTGEDEKKELSVTMSSYVHTKYHNAVLAELAVDGEWPCQVCVAPYMLLLARSILLTLTDPHRLNWMSALKADENDCKTLQQPASDTFVRLTRILTGAHVWSARAAVAHARLLQARQPPETLWREVYDTFQVCLEKFCSKHLLNESNNNINESNANWEERRHAATIMLEWGLAQHHFDRPGMGKKSFVKAKDFSGLQVQVTGASGVRTKFQTKNTAQMLVEAASSSQINESKYNNNTSKIQEQRIGHSEEEILLERIKFEDEAKNEIQNLTVLDQAIVLSLCLDVKNSNPTGDELTAEEMGAYLARVLDHHDDWMLYSTALLERAWLEFERTHGRERAILQIQALADQHTNRLTLTQSTRKSIEESAPVQDRLRNLHKIVYPPRWAVVKDLADRYANIGIFVSAAELFAQIELWDEVVECYRRSGRESKAEEIVRERLAIQETPRMWAALGDLTQDPKYWEKAVELSRGKFSSAFVALGAFYFDKGELRKAKEYYQTSLDVRPIAPAIWFRLGTINMQLSQWGAALRCFSRVVQLEPEEHEAWANVAAVHMRNKNPSEAYPALQESLKHFRNNWRVWTSKLYVCLDLKKYDEAIQACNMILDLKNRKQASDSIPPLEQRCVRAIVGGTTDAFQQAQAQKVDNEMDKQAAVDSAKRSLARVHALLNRLAATSNPEPWLYETIAFFHEQIGDDGGKDVVENLMKEYRALQSVPGWEKDDHQVGKVSQVVSQITQIQRREGSKDALAKSRFLVRGVIQKVRKSRMDETKMPTEVGRLEHLLKELEKDI